MDADDNTFKKVVKKTLMDTPVKQGLVENILEPNPKPQSKSPPQRLKMQLGMPIDFYGYRYKVIRKMKRGRVILKLIGEIPERES